MTHQGIPLLSNYNLSLVALSIVLVFFASYTAFDLVELISVTNGRRKNALLFSGAASMGIGIWSMHFIGMLAYHMPIPMTYDIKKLLISLLIPITASFLALWTACRNASSAKMSPSGLTMGIGVSAMHYIGVSAMQVPGSISYSPPFFTLSVLFAIIVSSFSLSCLSKFHQNPDIGGVTWKMDGALLMGIAVAGMHYTAMLSTNFTLSPEMNMDVSDPSVDSDLLASAAGIAVLIIFCFSLFGAFVGRKLAMHARLLRVREQHYKSLFENDPAFICSFDLSGNFISLNPAAEKITGYRASELLTHPFTELIANQTSAQKHRYHFEQAKRGISRNYGITIIHKNGQRIELGMKNVPIVVDDEVVGIYGVARDITQRKQVEEELRITKEHLESFFQNTADAIAVQDLNDHILQVNQAFEKMFGWSSEEILSQKFSFTAPGQNNEEASELALKVKLGEPVIAYETLSKRKDGQLIAVSLTQSPIRDADGNVVALASIARDVTERKRAEEALRKSERSLSHAQRIAHLGNWDWNIPLDQVRWSDEVYRIFGIDKDESISYDKYLLCIHPEDRTRVQTSIEYALDGMPFDIEFRIIRRDGSERIVHEQAEVLLNKAGQAIRMIGTIQDITERKQTEELLRKSEKLAVVGQLAAGVAHEIRNPLTALKGFVQLLQLSTDPIAESKKEYFHIMLSELDRINTIVNEFLMIAKPQVVNFSSKDVRVLLKDIIGLLDTQAIMHNVQILTHYDSSVSQINCDENQIKQVFINILKNSIDAMPQGGNISISVSTLNENSIEICFVDEGCGIPEERIPKLGEPFYTTKEKGTGLGLMVSYKIIEAHQGKIHIQSQVNQGTTVTLQLPVAHAAAAETVYN